MGEPHNRQTLTTYNKRDGQAFAGRQHRSTVFLAGVGGGDKLLGEAAEP